MDSIRNMLTATAAGGLLTAASVAAAQTVEGIPQPRRPLQQFAPRLRSRYQLLRMMIDGVPHLQAAIPDAKAADAKAVRPEFY
jgi:hypothetical protein